MKRRIAIKQAPELELQLKDKTYTIIFSNSLLIQYTEKYGEIDGKLNSCEFFARLIHCYFDYMGEDVSLGECKVIMLKGGDELLEMITESLIDAVAMSDNEDVKKKVMLARAELNKLRK